MGRTHDVELRFVDDNAKLVIPPVTLQFQSAGIAPGLDVEVTVPTVSFIAPTFGEPGRYSAEYWMGQRMLARVRLRVEQQAPGMSGPNPN